MKSERWYSISDIRLSSWIVPAILIVIMVLTSVYTHFLLFHLFAEFFTIFVALGIGLIAYYTFPFTKNRYLLFIGLGYVSVAFLDLMHTLTFPGMNILNVDGSNTTLTLWVLTRHTEAFILLGALFLRNRPFNNLIVTLIFAVITASILYISLKIPMELFIQDAGLTLLKIYLEYIVITVLLITMLLNMYKRKEFQIRTYKSIQFSIVFTVIAELFFTVYEDMYGIMILMGHIFKFLSFWVIFRSIVITSLQEPVIKLLESETELRHQHALLDSVLNATPDLIFFKDYLHQNGKYLGCNTAFGKFVGKSIKDIIDHDDIELFGEKIGRFFRSNDKIMLSKKQIRVNEEWVNYPDGRKVLLSTSKAPFHDVEGNINGVLGVSRDITAYFEAQDKLREQKDKLDYQAHYDSLTNLPNRDLFVDRLSQAIKVAQRSKKQIGVLFIDLDHFKEINDSLGHHVGDEVIRQTSNRLRQKIRKTDTIARLGGDEFTVILDTIQDNGIIVDIIQKLMKAMNDPIMTENHQLYITLSIGATIYPIDGSICDVLLKNADAAMYKAKEMGRNTYHFYREEMTEKAFERIIMETGLRQALEKEELIVYYQPQIDGRSDSLIGMEALVRWQNEAMGIVPPAKFIPLAEETGLIIALDQWVMRTAMTQMVEWYTEGLNPGRLALNLSMKQLHQKEFIRILETMLEETSCKPEWLELEITEGQIMTDPDGTILTMQQISDLGINLAIDDFGTGYSSLSYLKRLPIDKLKIDQSFVNDLPDNEEDSAISRTVIALAQNLNMEVLAEGVETEEQKNFLVENGCSQIQGYFYSKPMPASEFYLYLISHC